MLISQQHAGSMNMVDQSEDSSNFGMPATPNFNGAAFALDGATPILQSALFEPESEALTTMVALQSSAGSNANALAVVNYVRPPSAAAPVLSSSAHGGKTPALIAAQPLELLPFPDTENLSPAALAAWASKVHAKYPALKVEICTVFQLVNVFRSKPREDAVKTGGRVRKMRDNLTKLMFVGNNAGLLFPAGPCYTSLNGDSVFGEDCVHVHINIDEVDVLPAHHERVQNVKNGNNNSYFQGRANGILQAELYSRQVQYIDDLYNLTEDEWQQCGNDKKHGMTYQEYHKCLKTTENYSTASSALRCFNMIGYIRYLNRDTVGGNPLLNVPRLSTLLKIARFNDAMAIYKAVMRALKKPHSNYIGEFVSTGVIAEYDLFQTAENNLNGMLDSEEQFGDDGGAEARNRATRLFAAVLGLALGAMRYKINRLTGGHMLMPPPPKKSKSALIAENKVLKEEVQNRNREVSLLKSELSRIKARFNITIGNGESGNSSDSDGEFRSGKRGRSDGSDSESTGTYDDDNESE